MSKLIVPWYSWYYGMYVGPPKWQMFGDWVYEPGECGEQFETQEEMEDWGEESCAAVCPKCEAELTQTYDCPWLEEEKCE